MTVRRVIGIGVALPFASVTLVGCAGATSAQVSSEPTASAAESSSGVSVEDSPEPTEASAAFDLSDRSGWCAGAFDSTGLPTLYGTEVAANGDRGNLGNSTVGFAWNCVFFPIKSGWGFTVSWMPSSMKDSASALSDTFESMNPNFVPQATKWGSADGMFMIGKDSFGTLRADAAAIIPGADGAPGVLYVTTNTDQDAFSEDEVRQMFGHLFEFATANPPRNFGS